MPFNIDQILTYLRQERAWDEVFYENYKKSLAEAKAVRTVLRSPFVLHLFRQSWEALAQTPLNQLNRWQIYEGFIAHILKLQQPLLSKRVQRYLQGSYSTLLSSYQAFISEIAWRAFQQRGTTLDWKEAKGVSRWTQIKTYAEEVARDEFDKQQVKLKVEIDQAPEEKRAQIGRRSLINEADYVRLAQKRVDQFESELTLQLRGTGEEKHYEYNHKSIFEYGMAKRILLLKNSLSVVEEAIDLLNSRKIQEEPEALQFWKEGWKEIGSKALIKPFFEIITQSSEKETIQQASANSATLLAQAAVTFSGRSLQGVRLPRADLSGAILSHTCLEGAQLPGAVLIGTYLGHANLRNAKLSNVDFGQGIRLECKHSVQCLSYHPLGTQLALGLGNGNIELYNKEEEAYTSIATLKGHTEGIFSVTYSPDGQQLASGSLDKTVGLWDPHTQHLISLLKGHTGGVFSVTYRPDGQQLASGSFDNTIGLWDPHRQQLITLLREHIGRVFSVTYSPDGQQLASGSEDKTVDLWDPHCQELIKLLNGHNGMVFSVTYRPDGQQLASGSDDKTVGLWDPRRQQLIKLLKGHTDIIRSVTYSPDSQQLASGSGDNTVGLWDPYRQQLITLLRGHNGSVFSVTYRPDGQQLASGSEDKTVGLWDPYRQQPSR